MSTKTKKPPIPKDTWYVHGTTKMWQLRYNGKAHASVPHTDAGYARLQRYAVFLNERRKQPNDLCAADSANLDSALRLYTRKQITESSENEQ